MIEIKRNLMSDKKIKLAVYTLLFMFSLFLCIKLPFGPNIIFMATFAVSYILAAEAFSDVLGR